MAEYTDTRTRRLDSDRTYVLDLDRTRQWVQSPHRRSPGAQKGRRRKVRIVTYCATACTTLVVAAMIVALVSLYWRARSPVSLPLNLWAAQPARASLICVGQAVEYSAVPRARSSVAAVALAWNRSGVSPIPVILHKKSDNVAPMAPTWIVMRPTNWSTLVTPTGVQGQRTLPVPADPRGIPNASGTGTSPFPAVYGQNVDAAARSAATN